MIPYLQIPAYIHVIIFRCFLHDVIAINVLVSDISKSQESEKSSAFSFHLIRMSNEMGGSIQVFDYGREVMLEVETSTFWNNISDEN